MSSVISPFVLNRKVTVPVTRRAILARKRVTMNDPYKKFEAGQIYQIYGWEQIDNRWYCMAQNISTGEWQYILDSVFDWHKPDFEIRIKDMKLEIDAQNGGQDPILESR
jgi:hypothetical protein